MDLKPSQPIGVFDSGVGGLTVASAINNLLPNESIIYFGDTAHLPYGDKSENLIRQYSTQITNFLENLQCKVVLIACNSASAVAYDHLNKMFDDKLIVLNVIDPVVEYVTSKYLNNEKIGVIGTKATVRSGMYAKKILQQGSNSDVVQLATPLLVPMIEEGFIFDDISNAIIRAYLSNEALKNLNALILGCTHYPIIKNQIRKFYDFNVEILDSSVIVANYLKKVLEKNNLLNTQTNIGSKFFVSDYTDYFQKIANMFFEQDIKLELVNIS